MATASTPVVDSHLEHAQDLGRRGAIYSAQSEFIQVLRAVAQTASTEAAAQERLNALDAGLLAFTEAEDFSSNGSEHDGNIDIGRRILTHHTPVLHGANLEKVSQLTALQAYYTFGKQQLSLAGGNDRAASAALYGLARLQPVLGANNAAPKTVALLEAAVTVDPGNYIAANELGVLLFRHGQLEDARMLLIQSIQSYPRSETWHNIAVVCAALGRGEESERAQKYCQLAYAAEHSTAQAREAGGGLIYWVEKDKLANAPGDASWDTDSPNGANGAVKKQPVAQAKTDTSTRPSLSSLLPWNSKESK